MSQQDQTYLQSILDYDALTGIFTWKVRKAKRIQIGDVTGKPGKRGYIYISIDSQFFLAHRLAWLHVYGVWPSIQLDHWDKNRANNRISNLREATRAQNKSNSMKYKNNTSGYKGVSYRKDIEKFVARINVNGSSKYLGRFDTASDAHAAYWQAAQTLHGQFASQA